MQIANIEWILQTCSTFYVLSSKGSIVQLIFFRIWFSARSVWKGGWLFVSVLKLMEIVRFFSKTPIDTEISGLKNFDIWSGFELSICPCILGVFQKMSFYM